MLKKSVRAPLIGLFALALLLALASVGCTREVIKEVPVEKVVTQEVVRTVEVPVEKIVEVPVVVTPTAKKEAIKFHDGQWQSVWINNAIAMHIIEHGYGYPTESIEGTTVTMQIALPRGDLDVNMEMWRSNILNWVNEEVANRNIVSLGQIFETSTQGFYVPTYVIEGDAERGIEATAPDLKTVADLAKYPHLFPDREDASQAQFINCILGWRCQQLNRIKLNTYGLTTDVGGDYRVIEPGAAAGMDAAIASAYKNGEPVVAYYWEPTWLLGAYKMTLLEEPEFTDECWAKVQAALDDFADDSVAECACAYESFDVHKYVSSSLLQRAPNVVGFLSSMFLGTQMINDLAAYMDLEEKTAEETAIYFLNTFEEQWKGWVPEDVSAKVSASLN